MLNNSMDCIVLAGGFGTRLSSISNGIPKALLPVGNGVYLDLLLEKILNNKTVHVYLSLHYKSELFQHYVDNSFYKKNITVVIEPEPLGTGGAIKYVIENSTISSSFIVINGDSLSDLKFDQMNLEFEKRNLKAMIGISNVKDAERYGTVCVENGIVLYFQEKGFIGSEWVNNGHYIFKKESFDGFNNAFSLEKDVFPKLIKNQKLGVFKVNNDNFIDMGIPEDYEKLCNNYLG